MPYVKVGEENSGNIEIYYEDHGSGKPVVLVHGYPLSGRSWERQTTALLNAGYRVITYDRRGFGKSSQPISGYDYDTLAADLNTLIITLNLRDVALFGFSMGGGEVARYVGKHGSDRVSKAGFLSAITPFLLKTPDNPTGVDRQLFEGLKKAVLGDRQAFLTDFLANFFNLDQYQGKLVSPQVVQDSWNIAVGASPKGSLDCVDAWLTDFRKDLDSFRIPTLVIHGDADRICPFAATGQLTHQRVKASRLVVIEGGPHGNIWTHAGKVNEALIEFLGEGVHSKAKGN